MSSKHPRSTGGGSGPGGRPSGRSGGGSGPGGRSGGGSGSGGRSGGSSSNRDGVQDTGTYVDVGDIARAVSTCFLIIVFGSLLEPLATRFLPPAIGQFWLIAVAIVAFAIAGWRCGPAGPTPPLYGAGGALGSYILVIPLQFIQATFIPLYALYTAIAALVVGGVAGQLSARRV